MKETVRKHIRSLLEDENGRIDKKYGDISVLLVYPNSYQVGMSSLGYQTIYRLMNEIPDVRCDRGFLFYDEETIGLESGMPMRSYDIVAFSVSYELDYPNIVRMMRSGKIPLYSANRDETTPLVIVGGAITMINPEPIADFTDLFILGEAETILSPFFEIYRKVRSLKREEQISALSSLKGIYVPSFYTPKYDDGEDFLGYESHKGVSFPQIIHSKNIADQPAYSAIVTPNCEFSDMFLVEISRGCMRKCSFCAAKKAYHPYRYLDGEKVIEIVQNNLYLTNRVGLVGTVISDHPHIDFICDELIKLGAKISVSSFRADSASETLIRSLALSTAQSITIAPETGSAQLRKSIGKDITDEALINCAKMAKQFGIKQLRLYFMLGIPGDNGEDIEAIANLTSRLAEILPVKLAINPFIPKPFTEFERKAMRTGEKLREDVSQLRRLISRLRNAGMTNASVKESLLEAFYARSGREASKFLSGEKKLTSNIIKTQTNIEIPQSQPLPWRIIQQSSSL